jgi:GNAT superfamily N-acetyltransferase
MPKAGLALTSDLDSILDLFEQSQVSAVVKPIENARKIWVSTLAQKALSLFVSSENSKVVATCVLITAPNLLREGRKHGFIENVVTHGNCQCRGHGSAVLQAALQKAWTDGCFHFWTQSGRQNPNVHRFYEGNGFKGGLRMGYVARCPA